MNRRKGIKPNSLGDDKSIGSKVDVSKKNKDFNKNFINHKDLERNVYNEIASEFETYKKNKDQ